MVNNNIMLCPQCKKEMIVIESNQVQLDYCMFCHGFWFDYNEWNILTKKLISIQLSNEPEDLFNISKALTKEKTRKCPVCGKKMEKFLYYNELLDRCPSKHGIWFDEGEFSSCVNKSHFSDCNNPVVNFLGDVFNK